MQTIFLLITGCILAALLSLFPDQAPPYAWFGVLACFITVPVIAWLEYSINKFSSDFEEITHHTSPHDYS